MKNTVPSFALPFLVKCAVIAAFGMCAHKLHAQDLPPGDQPPPSAVDRIANAGDSEKYKNKDYLIVKELSINRVKSSGVTEVDKYILYKLLNRKSCRNFSVMNWGIAAGAFRFLGRPNLEMCGWARA